MTPEFHSVDEALVTLLREVNERGVSVAPRNMPTRELLNVGFKLTNPRARMIYNAARRWSPFLAIGELFWHLGGRRDVEFLSYYAPRWAKFADHEVIRSSCYGFKIFESIENGVSQWDLALDELRRDPSSRRAVISLYDATADLKPEAPDVACATSLQFLIRSGRLDVTVYMRSNDLIWGFSYDCFFFTMLQELAAGQLGCELGEYNHYAASLHVYERHLPLMRRILDAQDGVQSSSMPKMPDCPLDVLLAYERTLRLREPLLDFPGLPPYWGDLLLLLSAYKAQTMDEQATAKRILNMIGEPAYRLLIDSPS